MPDQSSLPDNLARLRKARNLSQEELAEAAAVGVDTVGRIERAERRMVRPETLERLARALGVRPMSLLGIDHQPDASDPELVANLRRAISATSEIPGLVELAEGDEVPSLGQLVQSGRRVWDDYLAGRTAELLVELPVLLVDSRRLMHASDGDTRAEAERVAALSYRLGAGLAGRLGLNDLAWSSAERAVAAARRSDSPELETAVSLRYLAWVLVRQGRLEEADRVAIRAAEAIQPRMLDRDRARAGVFGNLLFNAASAAVMAGRGDRAREYLSEAGSAAARFGADHSSEAAVFGPRLVGLQSVEMAVRLGDSEGALRAAERLPRMSRDVPKFWEAGHRLHLARAAADLRRNGEALMYLEQARDIAPVWASQQPLGRSTMSTLVDRAARRRGETFAQLAAHYGVS